MDKFKIITDIDSMSLEELKSYCEELNSFLINFEASSVKNMVMSLDSIAQKITEDLNNIITGEATVLTILVEDSKIFDKVQKIVEKIDSWKKVSDLAEGLRPEIAKPISKDKPKPTIKIDPTANAFEQIQKSINQKK